MHAELAYVADAALAPIRAAYGEQFGVWVVAVDPAPEAPEISDISVDNLHSLVGAPDASHIPVVVRWRAEPAAVDVADPTTIADAYDAGATIPELAAHLGVTRAAVIDALNDARNTSRSANALRQSRHRARQRGGPARALEPCGTTAAYRRHLRAGETPCDACKKANREASQRNRQ